MRSVKSVMRVATALLAAILGFLVVPRVGAEEGPVWCWFAACGGPAMGIEIQLDDTIVYQSVFPVCRVDRADPVSQGQRIGKIHFTFRPGRPIVWEGYRDTKDTTKAGHLLEADLWQAGADPDDLIIGLSFADARTIYMNTVHIAHPSQRDESVVAAGLRVVTYPVVAATEKAK
jgi:hypothetical protein